jgi:UPF0716 protein FxsA
MPRLLLGLVFIAFPLLELALLIKTGQRLGLWPTLAIIVGTALLGAHVLLRQGWTALRHMQEAMARGQPPVAPVIDSAFLMAAGMLLIMPGLIGDAAALLLLVPPIRHVVARWLVRRIVERAEVHVFVAEGSDKPSPNRQGRAEGPLIEGEFERLDEKATGPHRPGGRDQV